MKDIVTKNYSTDNGDTWVVGGKLVIEEGAEFSGFPRVENLAASANVASLIAALKKAKIMVGDAFTINVASCTPPVTETAQNSAAATITYADGVITVSVPKVSALKDADHGETWGIHKWIGFGVSTGLSSLVGLVFNDHVAEVTLTAADEAEAQSVGLNMDGQFVLYIKAEDVFARPAGKSIILSREGYEDPEIIIKVVETANS